MFLKIRSHATCDMWHVTHDMWTFSQNVNSLLSSYGFWVKVHWRYFEKGWNSQIMTINIINMIKMIMNNRTNKIIKMLKIIKMIPMDPNWYQWIPMDPNGSKWIQIYPNDFNGSKWIQIDPKLSKGIQRDPNSVLIATKKIHSWIFHQFPHYFPTENTI